MRTLITYTLLTLPFPCNTSQSSPCWANFTFNSCLISQSMNVLTIYLAIPLLKVIHFLFQYFDTKYSDAKMYLIYKTFLPVLLFLGGMIRTECAFDQYAFLMLIDISRSFSRKSINR